MLSVGLLEWNQILPFFILFLCYVQPHAQPHTHTYTHLENGKFAVALSLWGRVYIQEQWIISSWGILEWCWYVSHHSAWRQFCHQTTYHSSCSIHPVFLVNKINNRYDHGQLHVNIFKRGMVVVTIKFADDPHMPMRAYCMNHVLYCVLDGHLHLKIVQDYVLAWIDFMAPEKLTGNLMSETSIRFQGVFLGTLIYKLFAPVSWLQWQQDMLIVPICWITQRATDIVRLSVNLTPVSFQVNSGFWICWQATSFLNLESY